jgi:hypothetical protein
VKGNPFKFRQLVGYADELIQCDIARRFPASFIQDAGLAFEIAPIGYL